MTLDNYLEASSTISTILHHLHKQFMYYDVLHEWSLVSWNPWNPPGGVGAESRVISMSHGKIEFSLGAPFFEKKSVSKRYPFKLDFLSHVQSIMLDLKAKAAKHVEKQRVRSFFGLTHEQFDAVRVGVAKAKAEIWWAGMAQKWPLVCFSFPSFPSFLSFLSFLLYFFHVFLSSWIRSSFLISVRFLSVYVPFCPFCPSFSVSWKQCGYWPACW